VSTTSTEGTYPARLSIDFQEGGLDRLSTFFRLFWAIPAIIVLTLVGSALSGPVALTILFRQKYPQWWFDFNLQLTRFSTRVVAYVALMTDRYPSTDEEQSVHLDLDYPNVKQDLNRWLPLVKWLLAIPHYIVMAVLGIGVAVAVLIAWFAILFTGRYPRGIFNFVEGFFRWGLRVQAYAFLLVTDTYPPFKLSA
jgi:roadblock/LC7 domain-containing protein